MIKPGLKTLFSFAALLAAFALGAGQANAYTNSRLIDNAIFDNVGSMSEQKIRDFINSRPSSCLAASGAIFPEPIDYWTYGGMVDAARVIYRSSAYNEINPQVILATLEKEQTLISRTDCYERPSGIDSRNKAMGMGCPDGGACPAPGYEGFHQQVMKGSWTLAFARHRADGNVGWGDNGSIAYGGPWTEGNRRACSSCSNVYRDGWWTIDGQSIKMETGATASLYRYTPHLGQSFPRIFENWFGPVTDAFLYKSNASPQIYAIIGSTKYLVPSYDIMEAFNMIGKPVAIVSQSFIDGTSSGPTLTPVAKKAADPGGTIFLLNQGKSHPLSGANCTAWAIGCFDTNTTKTLPNELIDRLTSPGGPLKPMFANQGVIYKPEGGKKRPVLDERTLDTLGGYGQVMTVQNINATQALGKLLLSNGTVLKFGSNPTIYLYDTDQLHPVPGPEEFRAWDLLRFGVASPPAEWATDPLSQGGALSLFATDLGGSKYLIDRGQKFNLGSRPQDWSNDFINFGQSLLTALPTATLKPVLRSEAGTIFTVYEQRKYVYPTLDDFYGLGQKSENIGPVSSFAESKLTYAGSHLASGRLYKVAGSGDINIVEGSASRWVQRTDYNLPYNKIITVDATTSARYPRVGVYQP